MSKLHEIEEGSKIYADVSDGSEYVVFERLDGMYSYCESEEGSVVHLSASTPLEEYKEGYKISDHD